MRDMSGAGGLMAALIGALAVSGCSSVAEMPYPDLSRIVSVEGPSLSEEERAAMIETLKHDQQTHKDQAAEDIEKR